MSNPDIQHHELAAMRQAADRAPFDTQQKFHALLDAYETGAKSVAALEDLEVVVEEAVLQLRAVYPDLPDTIRKNKASADFGEPLSEDAWHERLEDCQTPEERAATIEEELNRARAAEVKLRARVEALEEAIESALEDLG